MYILDFRSIFILWIILYIEYFISQLEFYSIQSQITDPYLIFHSAFLHFYTILYRRFIFTQLIFYITDSCSIFHTIYPIWQNLYCIILKSIFKVNTILYILYDKNCIQYPISQIIVYILHHIHTSYICTLYDKIIIQYSTSQLIDYKLWYKKLTIFYITDIDSILYTTLYFMSYIRSIS